MKRSARKRVLGRRKLLGSRPRLKRPAARRQGLKTIAVAKVRRAGEARRAAGQRAKTGRRAQPTARKPEARARATIAPLRPHGRAG